MSVVLRITHDETLSSRSLVYISLFYLLFKSSTHWRQSRLLPIPATNRQQSRLLPIRSTLSPVCTGPKPHGRRCRLYTKSTVLNSTLSPVCTGLYVDICVCSMYWFGLTNKYVCNWKCWSYREHIVVLGVPCLDQHPLCKCTVPRLRGSHWQW